jgi:hypothetical protein
MQLFSKGHSVLRSPTVRGHARVVFHPSHILEGVSKCLLRPVLTDLIFGASKHLLKRVFGALGFATGKGR